MPCLRTFHLPIDGAGCVLASVFFVLGCLFETADFERTEILYAPVLNPAASSADFVGDTLLVSEDIVREGNQNVHYVLYRQEFGSWNPDLEFAWNVFFLKSRFLFQERLRIPDKRNLSALYASTGDPYTVWVDSAAAEDFTRHLFTTRVHGAIGIRWTIDPSRDTLVIHQVVPASPAHDAGLVKGMRVLEVGGVQVTGDSAAFRFSDRTQGDSGTTLQMALLHGDMRLEVTLVKRPVDFPSLALDTLEGVPWIQVYSFRPSTTPAKSTSLEFLDALEETAASPVLLLDLRGNGGGSVDEALRMADAIVATGVLIRYSTRRLGSDSLPRLFRDGFAGKTGGIGEGRRYVLLCDGGTASASEIFVAAISEGAGVPVVGERTYGKGIGQVVASTPAGASVKVTSTEFAASSGLRYHQKGWEPDREAEPQQALAVGLEVAGELDPLGPRKRVVDGEMASRLAMAEWHHRERMRPGIRDLLVPIELEPTRTRAPDPPSRPEP